MVREPAEWTEQTGVPAHGAGRSVDECNQNEGRWDDPLAPVRHAATQPDQRRHQQDGEDKGQQEWAGGKTGRGVPEPRKNTSDVSSRPGEACTCTAALANAIVNAQAMYVAGIHRGPRTLVVRPARHRRADMKATRAISSGTARSNRERNGTVPTGRQPVSGNCRSLNQQRNRCNCSDHTGAQRPSRR